MNYPYRRLDDMEVRVGAALALKRAADVILSGIVATLDPRQMAVVIEDSQRLATDPDSELSETTVTVLDIVHARLAGHSRLADRLAAELEQVAAAKRLKTHTESGYGKFPDAEKGEAKDKAAKKVVALPF